MPSKNEIKEMLAMMAACHELRQAIETGAPSSTAKSALAMIQEAIDTRLDDEERMLKWIEASCIARVRMYKSHRRTT